MKLAFSSRDAFVLPKDRPGKMESVAKERARMGSFQHLFAGKWPTPEQRLEKQGKMKEKNGRKKIKCKRRQVAFSLLARSLHFCRWFDFVLFSQGTGSRLCSNWIIYFRIICDWIAVHQFRNAKKSHPLSTERERGWKQTRFAPFAFKKEKKTFYR